MGAKRVCAHKGCPRLTDSTRCDEHTRERDRSRGSSTARGYGRDHRAERATWQRRLDGGERILCWRALHPLAAKYPCKTPSVPISADPALWHLGHSDTDRNVTMGPEHMACNLAATAALR